QPLASRANHAASAPCVLVRRASGGGALIHDVPGVDLTYSVAVPDDLRSAGLQAELYRVMHVSLVEVLVSLGVTAHRHRPANSADGDVGCGQLNQHPVHAPFLCFQRHTDGDVLIGHDKVLGSAQRRGRGALLQHGSVLLSESRFAPELPGVAQLTGIRVPPASELIQRWLQALHSLWPIDWHRDHDWPATQRERIELILEQKFNAAAWRDRR
ncbi:MAG: hypothetical protein KDA92_23605, partial [Planctomycetales bacterium]|nr:hypothetical protein [Planctomycetales bacterium]